ncbi:hypothetical protein I203_101543 [Kwoniella mangroviensis CBS 8507]|uniref:uncharacterized protein n=1 Tax=Kwoniella mangroviensis CBS 8507 TaxID=1296122 RepID=UPI00080D2D18|nr:uncharacterized protein I203_05596 [Kwoniella mangroviensis CBS 8507]OCF65348.1 hypothetical protein I203_05596 [Kwoniella mangroviensis CBS 8507]
MPFHLPVLGSGSRKNKDDEKKERRKSQIAEEKPAFIPTTPGSEARRKSLQLERTLSIPNTNNNGNAAGSGPRSRSPTPLSPTFTASDVRRPIQHRHSSSTSNTGGLQGILKNTNPTSPSISGSEYTTTSGSGSAFFGGMHKRMSSLAFDRTDTIESLSPSIYDEDGTNGSGGGSTPGTSVSSFNQHCPLPSTNSTKFPFFMMTISSVSTLSFIALPLHLRPVVVDVLNNTWKRGISKIQEVDYQPELMKKHKEKGCDQGVWEVTMKGEAWMPTSSEQVSSKRILIKLLTEFARGGYNLNSSFRTSAKDSGKDSLIFLQGEPDPEPIFFAVAFYSHDRIWIIDAEADVGQALEEGIKNWWVDGLRDARVRERHCRELRLRGAPWTAHSTQSLISARCIHLTILKLITHCDSGYDFVGSIDMADKEEGEMPVTFYRKRWTEGPGGWKMVDGQGNGLRLETVIS